MRCRVVGEGDPNGRNLWENPEPDRRGKKKHILGALTLEVGVKIERDGAGA